MRITARRSLSSVALDSLVSHQLRLLYGGAADGEGGGYLLNTTLAYNEARKDYFIFL